MAIPNLRIHDEGALRWDPAEVDVPGVPAIAPSDDPMSVMVAAVMPEIPTEVAEKVAATRAREEKFAADLAAARRAYRTTDDAGEQDIEAAGESIAPNGAGVGASNALPASATGQFGQLGQLLGLPMEMAGGALAAPQAAIQGVQGAADQVSQLAASMAESLGGADTSSSSTPPELGNPPELEAEPADEARPEQATGADHERYPEATAEEENGDSKDSLKGAESMLHDLTVDSAPRINL